jgi:hypothetical protein
MEGDSAQWMTYAALAERLGTTSEAIRARAIRGAWRRQSGNDGKTLVLPPSEILHTPGQQAVNGRSTAVLSTPGQRAINGRSTAVRRPGDPATVTALREHIVTLKADIERLTVELAGERATLAGERAGRQADQERHHAELAGERTARQVDHEQHQERLAAEQVARYADQERAAVHQADQERELAAARAAADRSTAELVDLARRFAEIAEKQVSVDNVEAEPEPPRRRAVGRAWRWFLRN